VAEIKAKYLIEFNHHRKPKMLQGKKSKLKETTTNNIHKDRKEKISSFNRIVSKNTSRMLNYRKKG